MPLATVSIGDPIKLKQNSLLEVEKTLASALSALTGDELVVSINNLKFTSNVIGSSPRVTFDIEVVGSTKQVESPF